MVCTRDRGNEGKEKAAKGPSKGVRRNYTVGGGETEGRKVIARKRSKDGKEVQGRGNEYPEPQGKGGALEWEGGTRGKRRYGGWGDTMRVEKEVHLRMRKRFP